MLKIGTALALACVLTMPATAQTNQSQSVKLVEYSSPLLPPASYKGQWWTSPDQCQYTRAGRPGEVVWYLIINTAHSKCPSRLIQRAYSDFN